MKMNIEHWYLAFVLSLLIAIVDHRAVADEPPRAMGGQKSEQPDGTAALGASSDPWIVIEVGDAKLLRRLGAPFLPPGLGASSPT